TDGHSFVVGLPNRSVFTDQQEQWLSVFREYPLTPLQRRILVCGMNEREISQEDIYGAIKTRNRDVYDREVTGLRNAHILVQIRTQIQARNFATQHRIQKSRVGRFKVQLPTSSKVEPVLAVFVGNLPPNATANEVKLLFESTG